ncbi:MAG: ACP S-malonyltransferase [Chloroflexota bacterium]
MKVLLDHHLKKQGILLWATMGSEGWLKLLDIPMLTFDEVGLPIDSHDRDVWRFAQESQLILLTGNRNHDGEDSLEQTIRDENTQTSLPVITVGIIDRMAEREYREQCAERLVEIVLNIENYLGVGRIYIP